MTRSQPTAADSASKPVKRVRILVGGDHPLYLGSLAQLIREHADFDLAGVVSSEEIVSALTDLRPGVAVLGPFTPGRKREAEVLSNAVEHVRVVFASAEAK